MVPFEYDVGTIDKQNIYIYNQRRPGYKIWWHGFELAIAGPRRIYDITKKMIPLRTSLSNLQWLGKPTRGFFPQKT